MTFSLEGVVEAILGNLGVLVTLLVIIYGGYKKWWVFGWYAKELSARNERLEQRVERISGLAGDATSLTTRVVDVVEKRTEATGV